MIEFREVTRENLNEIMRLDVLDHQKDQVAPNSVSIAHGNYSEVAWFRGIYNADEPVGFVMLSLNHKEKKYWIWRFMIDKNHQGKGYGRASIELIKKVMKKEVPEITEIYLSYVPKEKDGADGFYKKVGFEDTGKMSNKEKIMCYKY